MTKTTILAAAMALCIGVGTGAALHPVQVTHTVVRTVQRTVTVAPKVHDTAYHNVLTILPCIEEDSENCIWNASSSGNGEGESFIAYHGQVYYMAR